jgi:hypothetical protein
MDRTNGKEVTGVTAPVALNTLGVNVFTAPGKTMVGERPKPFGEALGFDPITSTLIFGEYDAVLVDAMGTVAEAEALADWVALHNRNLETIYITHAHFDHFYGLSILLERFPGARAIATPKTVKAMQMSFTPTVERLARRMFPGQVPTKLVSPESRKNWIADLDRLAALNPTMVVAGHKKPGAPDSPSTIQDTRRYLEDFDRLQKTATSDQALFDQMTELYPHWVANQSWLMFGFPQP